MSRLISEFLNVAQPSLAIQIEELERLSDRPGVDIKLANELRLLFKDKARTLGLDEDDTTIKELYFSMNNLVLRDAQKLSETIGVNDDDSPRQMIDKSIKFVEKRVGKKTVWALKPSVLKRQLKDNPPKKLMKIFGVRSIDSALKRERVSLFYCFAKFTEGPAWLSKYALQASKLTNSDFDNQIVTISIVADSRCKQLNKAGLKLNQIIYFDQESTGIEIYVPPKRFDGDVLFVVDSLLIQLKNMLRRSAYYRSQGLKPDFFKKVEKIRSSGFLPVESENYPFDWPAVIHAATEHGVKGLISNNEPFVSNEDIMIPSLPQLAGLDFWQHPFGIYSESGILIPFNLSDMIINTINRLPPERSYLENARHNLKNELFARYLAYEPLRQKALTHSEMEN